MTVNRKGLSKDADLLESLGNIEDTSVIDSTASASIIAALKGIIKQLQGDGSGEAYVDVTDRAARDLGKVDIAAFDVVGQAAMAASVPVVVASDQSAIPSQQSGYSSLAGAIKTVTSHGTAEALAADTACHIVQIYALDDNTDAIYVGGSNVASDVYGKSILPGDPPVILEVSNLNLVYVDSAVDAEGVSYFVS